jgi:oligopeptide transport system substrate-binding protein
MACQKNISARANEKQTLRINLRKEPFSLDPRKGNDMVASQVQFLLFEGLVRLNPDMSVSPAQAESYEISPDGMVYTFHLRDAFWSDGTQVTASDFEKTWKKILDPQFPSPDAYLLYAIRNAKRAKAGEIPLEEVGIQSKDEKTLVVELESPMRNFLQIVASSVLLPVSEKVDEADPHWASHPKKILSNGPFCLKEWLPQQKLIFEKNSLYHGAAEVNLDRILIDIIDQEVPILHMHANGHFDLIGTPLSFFPSTLLEDLERQKSFTFFPVATTKFLAFNTSTTPFNNANIRRAFAYAISRESLIQHVTKLQEKKALNVIPPVLVAESKDYFSDGDTSSAQTFFQKGLEELGLKSLEPPLFMFVSSEINKTLALALQQMWFEALGVQIILKPIEFKELHERSHRGDFSMGIFAWLADYGDPMNILERFTEKDNHRNYPKWHNKNYNDLLTEARKIHSRSEYLDKVREAEQLLIDEMPFTCLFHENYAFLIQPYVTGFAISPLGHIYFERISIDVTQQQRYIRGRLQNIDQRDLR